MFVIDAPILGTPQNLGADDGNGVLQKTNAATVDKDFTLKWDSVTGATSYVVQIKLTGGNFTNLDSPNATQLRVTNKATATYRARACVSASRCGTWSSELSVGVRPCNANSYTSAITYKPALASVCPDTQVTKTISYTKKNGFAHCNDKTDEESKVNGTKDCATAANCNTGDGTSDDPKIVCTYAQLKAMANGLDKHYRLGQNVNANASCPDYDGTNGKTLTACGDGQNAWETVGISSSSKFTGSLDGAGFVIRKLYYKKTNSSGGTLYGGLFGYTDGATIKNVGLEDAYIHVSSTATNAYLYSGGLVGRINTDLPKIVGKNYYVDADGTNGVGRYTSTSKRCTATVCIHATGADVAARRSWLQSQNESGALFPSGTTDGINYAPWSTSIWSDLTTAGKYPCLRGVTPGCN